MRAIRIAIRSVAAVAAVAVLAVIPSAASATLAQDAAYFSWGDGNPLGTYTQDGPGGYEDHVTLSVSGDIGISKTGVSATCEVSGDIDAWNDYNGAASGGGLFWELPGAWADVVGPDVAHNAVASLDASNCSGYIGSCAVADATFGNLPWAGTTGSVVTVGGAPNYEVTQAYDADFSGVSVTWTRAGGGSCNTSVVSTGTLLAQDEVDYSYGSAVRSFTFDGSSLSTSGGVGATTVNGTLAVTGGSGPGVDPELSFEDYGGLQVTQIGG